MFYTMIKLESTSSVLASSSKTPETVEAMMGRGIGCKLQQTIQSKISEATNCCVAVVMK